MNLQDHTRRADVSDGEGDECIFHPEGRRSDARHDKKHPCVFLERFAEHQPHHLLMGFVSHLRLQGVLADLQSDRRKRWLGSFSGQEQGWEKQKNKQWSHPITIVGCAIFSSCENPFTERRFQSLTQPPAEGGILFSMQRINSPFRKPYPPPLTKSPYGTAISIADPPPRRRRHSFQHAANKFAVP